jgi:hypothetical protein
MHYLSLVNISHSNGTFATTEELYWHTILTHSPQFSIKVRSWSHTNMGLDKCMMISFLYCSMVQSSFSALKSLHREFSQQSCQIKKPSNKKRAPSPSIRNPPQGLVWGYLSGAQLAAVHWLEDIPFPCIPCPGLRSEHLGLPDSIEARKSQVVM